MIRSILRNVQYYLLFFSILLVLLAFKRLSWYDNGYHPYAFTDPEHRYSLLSSSPDRLKSHLFYGGEEREIDLFKFKLGLFKFILPTFAKDGNWDQGHSLTVPPPPKRRSHKRHDLRVEKQSTKKSAEIKTSKSVAYVVVIPLQGNQLSSWETLSNVIKKAQVNSSFGYEMYALKFSENAGRFMSKETEELSKLGFKMIRVQSPADLNLTNLTNDNGGLNAVARHHDLLVHMNLLQMLKTSLDDQFNELMKRKPNSTDSLILQSSDTHGNHLDVTILQTSSKDALSSYVKYLECEYLQMFPKQKMPTARISVSRRNQEVKIDSSVKSSCKLDGGKSQRIDR